jgi:hypothetical protein
MKGYLKIQVVLLASLLFAICADANTISWKNASSGNWSDTSNWNPKHVPGPSDTADISKSGNYTVTLDTNANVGGLILGAGDSTTQTLLLNGQTFTLAGQATVTSNAVIDLSSGTFNGDTNSSGAIFTGTLTCSGGAVAGKLTLTSNSVLNLSDAANPIGNLATVTNYGTVNWSNGDITGQDGMRIYNYGLWVTTSDYGRFWGSGIELDNFGIFRKGGVAATYLTAAMNFNNSGTVVVQGGELVIHIASGGGIYSTTNGTVLYFGLANSLLTNRLTLTTNVTFNGTGLVAGRLTGSNAVVNGSITLSNATLSGALTLASNATMLLESLLIFTNFTFTNYGTVNWDNTDLAIASPLQIRNYGLWVAQSDNAFSGSSTVFGNYGTFRKAGGNGNISGTPQPQTYLGTNTTFNNYGMVDTEAGLLYIASGTGSGTFNNATNAGTVLGISGIFNSVPYYSPYILTGNPIFSGSGVLFTGDLTGSNVVVHGIEDFQGGGLFYGTFTFANDNVFRQGFIYAPMSFQNVIVTNYGTVEWNDRMFGGTNSSAQPSQIYNYGLWDTQTNAELYDFTFNNYGTFRKSGGLIAIAPYFSSMDAASAFNNYGIVDIQSGQFDFSPVCNNYGGSFDTATNTFVGFGTCNLNGTNTFTGPGIFIGTLNGNNAVIQGTENFKWGTLSGAITLATNNVLNLITYYTTSFNNLVLTNYGTVEWNYGGYDLSSANAQVYNYGLWDTQTNATLSNVVFNNYGTFRKSGGYFPYGTLFDNNSTFNNYGTIDLEIGALDISTGSGGGNFKVATNAALSLGNFTLIGNPTFAADDQVSGNLTCNNCILHGSLLFNYGSFSGTLTVASNGTVRIGATRGETSPIGFNALMLTNYGMVLWSNLDLQCQSNSRIYNYGLWDCQSSNTFNGGILGGTTFNNYGTFRKSGGPNAPPNFDTLLSGQTFNNYGTIDVQIGFLGFTGTDSDSGIVNTATNAFTGIAFGNFVLSGNPIFSGPANIFSSSLTGDHAVVHGSENFYGALSGTITLAADNMINLGTLAGSESSTLTNLVLTNYGTVIWSAYDLYGGSSPQIYNYGLWDVKDNLTLHGGDSGGTTTFNNYGTFRKSGGASVPPNYFTAIDNNTTFNNYGTADCQIGSLAMPSGCSLAGGTLNCGINNPADLDRFIFVNNIALSGTLSVNFNNGYSPTVGDTFQLVFYNFATGTFDSLNLPHLPPALAWQTNYINQSGTFLTLSVVSAPPLQLSSANVNASSNSVSFSWNGSYGQLYQVQCSTNLASTNWVNLGAPIPGTDGTMSVSDPLSGPRKFYRIQLQ